MAGTKEIKRRLRSVQSTSKITYAMKLVSAAKLKKVQDAVVNSRFYTKELAQLLSKLNAALGGSSFSHPLLETRDSIKNVALVVVGGQRGLCGGYNSNVNKKIESELKEIQARVPGAKVSMYVLGKKPAEYLRKTGRAYVKSYETLSENTAQWPIDELCVELEQEFITGSYDEVRLCFTQFQSAISMKTVGLRLFPLEGNLVHEGAGKVESGQAESSAPVKFEPNVAAVLSAVLPRVARSKLRQACLDAKASETGSRMTAMDAATRNAKELTKKLQRSYNKVRQQGITSQLLDIIGGAEAV